MTKLPSEIRGLEELAAALVASPQVVAGFFGYHAVPTNAVLSGGLSLIDPTTLVLGGAPGTASSLHLAGADTGLTDLQGVVVGSQSGGSLTVADGAMLANTGYGTGGCAASVDAIIGDQATGKAVVTGAGSSWQSSGNSFIIGDAAGGRLTVSHRAVVNSAYEIELGALAGGSGLLTIKTGGTVSFTTTMYVAEAAGSAGMVDIRSGGTLLDDAAPSDSTALYIGYGAGATGVVNVRGIGAVLSLNGNPLSVGYYGRGTLAITDDGTASFGTTNPSTDAALLVGSRAGADGTVLVDGAGSSFRVAGFGYIARGGSGALTVSHSAVATVGDSADAFEIGDGGTSGGILQVGGNGTLKVSTDGVLAVVETLEVGNNGDAGEATVDSGGVISAGGQIIIGDGGATYGAGVGTVTVGPGGTLKAGQTPGAVASYLASIVVGNSLASTMGTLDVTGPGALVDTGGYRMGIGVFGVGVVNVRRGGTVLAGSTGPTQAALRIGANAGAVGTITIADTGSTFIANGQAGIGVSGDGTLLIESGGEMTTGSSSASLSSGFIIGGNGGSQGGATITDVGSTLTNVGSFIVGDAGLGSLLIEKSGSASTSGAVGDGADIALAAGSNGSTVTVNGAGSTWSIAGSLDVAVGASGALSIDAGGQVSASAAAGQAAFAVGLAAGTNGSVAVDGKGSSLTAVGYGDLGEAGRGTLTVSDAATVTIGSAADTTSAPMLPGNDLGRIFDVGGGGAVGAGGEGQLTVTSKGLVDVVGALIVGDDGDSGVASVGDGGVIEAGGQISIGNTSPGGSPGDGTVNVGAGGTLKAGQTAADVPGGLASIVIGNSVAATVGLLTVSGAGALVDTGGYRMGIGIFGTGTVAISDRGTVRATSPGVGQSALRVGANAGSNGTLSISDAGSTFVADGQATIGTSGAGHLLIQAGGAMTTGSASSSLSSGFIVGVTSGSEGDATITGAGSTLTNIGSFIVGDASAGSMLIGNGGSVATGGANGDGADIALAAGSQGSEATVTGPGSNWTVAGSLEIGVGAAGSLTIADGGQVSATDVDVGAASGGSGSLTLTAADSSGAIAGTTLLNVANTLNVGVVGSGTVFLGAGTTINVQGSFDVGANGTVTGAGTIDPATTTIASGGVYLATGSLTSSEVIDNGTIAPRGGALAIDGAVDGTGIIDVGSGDQLTLTGAFDAKAGDGLTLSLTGPDATLDLKDPAGFAADISGYATGDEVEVYGIAGQSPPTYSYASGDTIATYANGITLTFAGTHAAGSIDIAADMAPPPTLPCFLIGTHIATQRGEIAVEDLHEGDRVLTVAGASRPIRWIGRRSLDATRHADPASVLPVRIRRDAFGIGKPHCDLFLSPDHAVFVDDVLIAIRQLINGATIAQLECERVIYYHVELDRHDVLFAEGLAAESYLDSGNRAVFANAGAPMTLHPHFARNAQDIRASGSCAPLVVAADRVEPIWQRLAARAAALGHPVSLPAATHDPVLRLGVADRCMEAVEIIDGRHVFVLPPRTESVRIISGAAAPADLRPWLDDRRRLGVSINRIVLGDKMDRKDVPMDHPALAAGWHDVERCDNRVWRWTNGYALLPVSTGTSMVEIHLAACSEYPAIGKVQPCSRPMRLFA